MTLLNRYVIKGGWPHLFTFLFFRKRNDILKSDLDNNPLDKLPTILKKNLDKNLCVCNEVPKMDIINAIVKGAITVEAVRKETYATMGTGCCTQQVERLIECLTAPEKRKRPTRAKSPEKNRRTGYGFPTDNARKADI